MEHDVSEAEKMTYEIVFKKSVKKDIRGIPQLVMRRIQAALLGLRENPFPEEAKKLQGYDTCYRIRVGNYRIIYEVAATIKIITIMRIADRKDVYRIL